MKDLSHNTVLKAGLIYGAILGFVLIAISVVFTLLGISFKPWAGLLSAIIMIGLFVYCLFAYRKEYLGGFASFEVLMQMTFIISFTATILVTIYNTINMVWLDPDLATKSFNISYEMIQQRLERNSRIPDDMLEEILDDAYDKMKKRMTTKNMLIQGVIGSYLMNVVIGLIISAFLKKEQAGPAENVA